MVLVDTDLVSQVGIDYKYKSTLSRKCTTRGIFCCLEAEIRHKRSDSRVFNG